VRLTYATGSFPVDGVEVTTSTVAVRTDGGRPFKYTTQLTGSGVLLGSGAQELSRLQLSLESVLSRVGGDFILLDDNNATTSIRLLSKGAEYPGVVVTDFAFPEARNGELVTGRTFTFSAQATYPSNGAAGAILSYAEAVEIVGNGGPQISWQQSFNGVPVPVRLFPVTMSTVIQSGQAVGYLAYPTPPPPVLPIAYLDNPAQSVRRTAPKPNGTEYSIAWRYVFRFPGRLVRPPFPNVYIG
jgi:hypothetical protein